MSIAKSKLSDLTILVVEDQPDTIEIVTRVFEFYGTEVHSAHNGEEALEKLSSLIPDMILCDLAMPVMDGWVLISHIRKIPRFVDIPVIALTAFGESGDKERALSLGFTSYISKPIMPVDLLKHIQNSLKLSAAT